MGIYSDGKVYGISLVLNHIVLFEEKYQESLTGYQLEPVKECYNRLTEEEKDVLTIHFYTACSVTYSVTNAGNCFCWFLGTKEMLVELFKII